MAIRIVEGFNISEGINIYNGINVIAGISLPSGGSQVGHIIGMTSAEWNGNYTVVPITTTYQKISKLSVSKGLPPIGMTDNNDGSFTNISGSPLTISGSIILSGYQSSSSLTFTLVGGTDNSGVDTAIISNAGMTKPFASFANSLAWVAEYTVVLQPGKKVFPMMKTNSGSPNINIGSLTHTIWSRA